MGEGPECCRRAEWPLGRRLERVTALVPLLLTGVRLHPPGRTDKNLCRCFGAPARRVSPDHPDHKVSKYEEKVPVILVTLELRDTLEARNRCALPSSRPSLGLRMWWCRKVPSVRSI